MAKPAIFENNLAPAEGPWKMEHNFRQAACKSRYPLSFAVVNAGNIREFVFGLSAFADMMRHFNQYHADAFLKKYCATGFGAKHADEMAKLYKNCRHAYWQPRHNDLPAPGFRGNQLPRDPPKPGVVA